MVRPQQKKKKKLGLKNPIIWESFLFVFQNYGTLSTFHDRTYTIGIYFNALYATVDIFAIAKLWQGVVLSWFMTQTLAIDSIKKSADWCQNN